jgi:hypothetical protein
VLQHVAGAKASELMWPGVPVLACATMRARLVEQGAGEVAGLAHDRAEGDALQRAWPAR